jgi:hypothetical protein
MKLIFAMREGANLIAVNILLDNGAWRDPELFG